MCKIVARAIVPMKGVRRGVPLTGGSQTVVVAAAPSACSHMITARLRGAVSLQRQVKLHENPINIANRQDFAKDWRAASAMAEMHDLTQPCAK